jgi:uncharacterized membrane protein YkoI
MLQLAALTLVFPVTADHLEWEDENRSYDQARRAVADGRALTLPQMIEHLGRVAPGQIVAIEYEHEFERWVYEFKIIDAAGSLQTVHLDALSGELVQMADE